MWYHELFYRLAIFSIRDFVEIGIITSALYLFSIWLKQDIQKPLVLYFYSLCSLVILVNVLDLPTLSNSVNTIFPVIIMLFILIHQKSLQQNFVTLKNIHPAQIVNTNWVETLLRACIIAANNKQTISCLIEGQNAVQDLVACSLNIKAKLTPELLDALTSSASYDPNKMIWLGHTGLLIGLNTSLLINEITNLTSNWQTHALWFTKQTDALIFRLDPHTKYFDIITEGKLIEHVGMDHAIKLMRKHFKQDPVNQDIAKNRKNHDYQIAKKSNEQLTT